jgi:hypothetical protein
VLSDKQTDCNGNKWRVQLHPGGETSDAEEGYTGLYLSSRNEEIIEAKYNFSIIDNGGSVCEELETDTFYEFSYDYYWGWNQFMKRSDILDPARKILKDGALCIDVTIQVKQKNDDMYQPPSQKVTGSRQKFSTSNRTNRNLTQFI